MNPHDDKPSNESPEPGAQVRFLPGASRYQPGIPCSGPLPIPPAEDRQDSPENAENRHQQPFSQPSPLRYTLRAKPRPRVNKLHSERGNTVQMIYRTTDVERLLAAADADRKQETTTAYHEGHYDGWGLGIRRGLAIGFAVGAICAALGLAIGWLA